MTDPTMDLFNWKEKRRSESGESKESKAPPKESKVQKDSDEPHRPQGPQNPRFRGAKHTNIASEASHPTGLVYEHPKTLTVTQVNNLARNKLERDVGVVAVIGEISNYKKVASGHHYFSLKDRTAQLPAAMFKREASRLALTLRNGIEVIATGRLTIYSKAGRYQIVVERIEPRGAGALQAAFEELKRRLEEEGLFDERRKRPLPRVPARVGVVTSPTGAVIRDVVNVATRRFPGARILLVPTTVQGADAARSIARAIERAGQLAPALGLDVLIVARGGGSFEDLWGFNEEVVVRAIAAAPIPVVSGIGHETDFTIADFVADRRAATPSAAAELVFPVRSELVGGIRRSLERAGRGLRRQIELDRHGLRTLRVRLGDGAFLVREPRQRLIDLQAAIHQGTRDRLVRDRLHLEGVQTRLAGRHPRAHVADVRGRIAASVQRLYALVQRDIAGARRHVVGVERLAPHIQLQLEKQRGRLAAAGQRLDALSPLRVLQRGYAIVQNADGNVVRDAAETEVGERLDIRVARGQIGARVEEISPNASNGTSDGPSDSTSDSTSE